jgi:hypothetical protein
LAATLILLGALMAVGCGVTRIADILRDPGRYTNREVTVAGDVVNSFGALGQGAFEVDDGTGRIWVLSLGFSVPSRGARVAVTGRVESGVTIGGRSFATVLRETRRRHSS